MTCRSALRTLTLCTASAWLAACVAQTPATPTADPNVVTPAQLTYAEQNLHSLFNSEDAFSTVLQAANQGSPTAKRDLGLYYLGGLSNDPGRALRWFLAAAHGGDVRAPSYIGDYYLAPSFGTPAPEDALFWYQKANRLHDARGTLALAQLSCKGVAVPLSLPTCGTLLDAAAKFRLPSDPPDVLANLSTAYTALGNAYRDNKKLPHHGTLASAAYGSAAALGSIPAALAEARLYYASGELPQDLPRATAIVDAAVVVARKQDSLDAPFNPHTSNRDAIVAAYTAIGQKYEAKGRSDLSAAGILYSRLALDLDQIAPLMALIERYIHGDHVPIDADRAYALLKPIMMRDISTPQDDLLYATCRDLAALYAKATPPNQARVTELAYFRNYLRILTPAGHLVPAAAAAMIVPDSSLQRYPNLEAPNAVPAQQEFTVSVSLDSVSMDANTQILNGTQDNGQLEITLPQGMSSLRIDVALIATGMTFPGGSNQGFLILNAGTPFSVPASIRILAGAKQETTLYAVLTDHTNGNFLAELGRKISITDPAPATPQANTLTDSAPPTPPTPQPPVLHSAQPHPPIVTLEPPKPAPPVVTQPASPLIPQPAAPAPDLTIVETHIGNTLTYMFYGPSTDPTDSSNPDAIVADRDALKLKVENTYYPALQDGSNKLANGNGQSCADDRKKSDTASAASDCADSLYVQGVASGIGNDLYTKDGPRLFQTVLQNILATHAPLHYITVVSNDPVFPWELVCVPTSVTDKACTPLGLTAAIVRQNAGASQNALADEIGFQGIDIIAPDYDPPLTLPNQAVEVAAIQKVFPNPISTKVEGDSDDVREMIETAPQGIIHFSGHGMRVALPPPPPAAAPTPSAAATTTTASAPATPAAPPSPAPSPAPASPSSPEVAIALEDVNMTPRTFLDFRKQGNDVHPFYFFNACDLGQSDRAPAYVDGWAADLINSGASGYLGALYQVSDATAASFATHFYADLKAAFDANKTPVIADIVNQARQETYAEANDPSALAYTLYSRQYLRLHPTN